MKGKLEAGYLDESSYGKWNALVNTAPQGSIYSTTEYLEALCSVAGGRFRILAVRRGDDLVGGIALYERDYMFGTYVSHRLLLYYHSLIIREYPTRYPSQRTARTLEILDLVEKELSGAKYGRLWLHNRWPIIDLRPFLSKGWIVRPSYTYEVPLTEIDVLWRRMDRNVRRLINRCADHGVIVADDDDFTAFYNLHYQTHKRKGSPLYLDQPSFLEFYTELKEKNLCRLYHARLPDGRSVATQLVLLGQHPVSHTVCAGADDRYMKLGTTPFLRWKVFECLSAMGYRANDLTDASLNPVTRFKSQLGGDLRMNTVVSQPDILQFTVGHFVSNFIRRGRSFLRNRWGN